MSASIGAASFGLRPELISATHRRLRRMGFSDPEAANLAALKSGFLITSQPWTVRELTRLLFLRELMRTHGEWSGTDDRADTSVSTSLSALVGRTPADRDGASAPPRWLAHSDDSGPSDGRVTLLTLFRSLSGPDARLNPVRPSSPPGLDAAGAPIERAGDAADDLPTPPHPIESHPSGGRQVPGSEGGTDMSTITTKDGTEIYYKDWGTGPVVTFSHGWPLNADAWDGQMLFLAQNGYRVVAHDRRGHGRSSQASSSNDMNGYADDLAAVIEALDLRDATLIGHSTGGGEVARYIGRHGTARVARAVLIAAVPPIMVQTPANPEGLPIEVFDGMRAGLFNDRSQFYHDLAVQFYGANRPGSAVSQGLLDQFWTWSMQAGLKNAYESIKAFSETDFTEDLKKFDVPTLLLHGEDDQIVPVRDSAVKSARLIPGAKDIYYPGAPHGITATHQDQVNTELLAFLRAKPMSTRPQPTRESRATAASQATL
jgi:non-heme chloroperoxidase